MANFKYSAAMNAYFNIVEHFSILTKQLRFKAASPHPRRRAHKAASPQGAGARNLFLFKEAVRN
jgi:hypothetical protein